MTKSGRKKCLSFSPVRRRRHAAKDRRFCIMWINRMVNKQVEKRMAELRSELLRMREEMAAELQEQLRALVAEEARERSGLIREHPSERVALRWRRKVEKESKERAEEEDEKDEAIFWDLDRCSFNFSETSSDTDNISIMKGLKYELRKILRVFFDSLCSDDDTSDVSNDSDTSSQPTKCEQEEIQQISSDVTVADTSQLMKASEKESSTNLSRANPRLIKCEEERVQVDPTKEENSWLMLRQWKEWMDKQEMGGNHDKVKPVDQQNTEKQGGAAAPASPKQMKQNKKYVKSMAKLKTYFSDFFNPRTSPKWERFEDDED